MQKKQGFKFYQESRAFGAKKWINFFSYWTAFFLAFQNGGIPTGPFCVISNIKTIRRCF